MVETQHTEEAEAVAGLVDAARRGDQAAFRSLYDSHVRAAFGVAVGILGRGDDAEDVVQESFVKLFGRLDDLDEPRAFGAWLLRTVRNRAIDVARASKVRTIDPWDLPEDAEPVAAERGHADDLSAGLALAEAREVVDAAFGALGERDATALRLSSGSDIDGESLATALDVESRQHAYTILNRARSRFRVAAGAFLLTRHGKSCDRLRRMLAAGDDGFSASVVRTVHAHVRDCDTCERRRALLLEHPEMAHAMEPPLVAPAAAERMWGGISRALPPSPRVPRRHARRLTAVGAAGAVVVAVSLLFAIDVGEQGDPTEFGSARADVAGISDFVDGGTRERGAPEGEVSEEPGPGGGVSGSGSGSSGDRLEGGPATTDPQVPGAGSDPAPGSDPDPGPEPGSGPGDDDGRGDDEPPPRDGTPPTIGPVAVSPGRVFERGCDGSTQAKVSASVSDPSGIASAGVSAAGVASRLSVSGGSAGGTIGPFPIGTAPAGGAQGFTVTVTVTDTAGNSATALGKLSVVSCQPAPTPFVPEVRLREGNLPGVG